jgi:ParB family chromosome partitioning protein
VELEPRSTAPAHATGAVEFVPLADVSDDATFRLRDEGDVAALAASIGRLGQLAPVELRPLPGAQGGPRWQVVAGFRRLAAVRLLARERVLARVHAELGDEDAWGLALGEALLAEPLLASELEALRERLAESGIAPWAEELLPDALARSPVDPDLRERYLELLERGEEVEEAEEAEEGAPDAAEVEREAEVAIDAEPEAEAEAGAAGDDETEEVTAEELAEDLAHRMYALNQDLALAADAWAELPPEGRRMIVAQASYVARLLPFLEEEEP